MAAIRPLAEHRATSSPAAIFAEICMMRLTHANGDQFAVQTI